MSGLFRCASAHGQGSMFFFGLPVGGKSILPSDLRSSRDAVSSDNENLSAEREREENDKLQILKEHVLVVDDNKVNLKLACRKVSLIVPAAQIHSAMDGRQGADAYVALCEQNTPPKIVFMDYHMPVMSGLDSIKIIRQWEREHDVSSPVWISCFTADLSEHSKRELMEAGANSFLPKPCPGGLLEDVVKRVLLYGSLDSPS